MQLIDIANNRAPTFEGVPLYPTTIIIPCPVSSSSALYLSIICIITFFWIIFRFFSTHGTQDLRAVTVGVGSNYSNPSSATQSPPLQPEQTVQSESSEEFPFRPPAPKLARKPLLRLFIVASLCFSMILLITHLLLSFTRPYRVCREKFGRIFPALEDSRTSNGWRYSLAVLSLAYHRDTSIQNTAYASSMMFDFSRAFLLSGILLLYSDFPGAVFRQLPVAMSKGYFQEWKNSFTLFGYLYAPLSLIVVLLLRTLVSPTSQLMSVLISQYYLDAETLLLFLICSVSGIIFTLKRHKRKLGDSSIFSSSFHRDGALSDSVVFSDRQRYLLLSEFHITEYFAETSFVLAACLLSHSVCNAISYSIYQLLGVAITQPWLSSLMFWLQYLALPLAACVVMFVIYPREDANATSRVYMAAIKPLLNAINRRPTTQALAQTMVGYCPPENPQPTPQQTPIEQRTVVHSVPEPAHRPLPRINSLGAGLHRRSLTERRPTYIKSYESMLSRRPSYQELSYRSICSHRSGNSFRRTSRQILADSAYYPEIYTSNSNSNSNTNTNTNTSSLDSWKKRHESMHPPSVEVGLRDIMLINSVMDGPITEEGTSTTSSHNNRDTRGKPYVLRVSETPDTTFSRATHRNEVSSYDINATPQLQSREASEILIPTRVSVLHESNESRVASYVASLTRAPLTQSSLITVNPIYCSSSDVSSLISSMSSGSKNSFLSYPVSIRTPDTKIDIPKPQPTRSPNNNNYLLPPTTPNQRRYSPLVTQPRWAPNPREESRRVSSTSYEPNWSSLNSFNGFNFPAGYPTTRTNSGTTYNTGVESLHVRSPSP